MNDAGETAASGQEAAYHPCQTQTQQGTAQSSAERRTGHVGFTDETCPDRRP